MSPLIAKLQIVLGKGQAGPLYLLKNRRGWGISAQVRLSLQC